MEELLNVIKELRSEVAELKAEIKQLQSDRYPRYVGLPEACQILGIGRTTMTKRLQQGYYNFAFQENGHWRFPLNELQRTAGRL